MWGHEATFVITKQSALKHRCRIGSAVQLMHAASCSCPLVPSQDFLWGLQHSGITHTALCMCLHGADKHLLLQVGLLQCTCSHSMASRSSKVELACVCALRPAWCFASMCAASQLCVFSHIGIHAQCAPSVQHQHGRQRASHSPYGGYPLLHLLLHQCHNLTDGRLHTSSVYVTGCAQERDAWVEGA